jgi:hypothetical protein
MSPSLASISRKSSNEVPKQFFQCSLLADYPIKMKLFFPGLERIFMVRLMGSRNVVGWANGSNTSVACFLILLISRGWCILYHSISNNSSFLATLRTKKAIILVHKRADQRTMYMESSLSFTKLPRRADQHNMKAHCLSRSDQHDATRRFQRSLYGFRIRDQPC